MGALLWGVDSLGNTVRAAIAAVFSLLFKVIRFPFVMLYRGAVAVKKTAVSSFRRVAGDEKFFTGRFVHALKGVFYAMGKEPRSVPSVVRYYARRSAARYGGVARYLLLLAVPVIAGVAFFFTLGHFSTLTPAYRLTSGDVVIGYVDAERTYLSARQQASALLHFSDGEASGTLPDVTLSPELVKANRFSSEDEICEKLLSLSSAALTRACGIYIDNEFFCLVKSESEARAVFDEVLTALSGNADGVSSFVEQISYRQGTYPDDPALFADAGALREKLMPAESDRYYTLTEEMYPTVAAEANGLTLTELIALNPQTELVADTLLPAGTALRVWRAPTPLTVKTVAAEVVEEIRDYETVEIKSDSLYVGTNRVVVEGQTGADRITNLVTYIGGDKIQSREISRVSIREPVAEMMQIGTRALDSSYVVAKSFGGLLLWPVPDADRINSDYAWRWGKLHAALDIGSSVGTSLGKTVVAAASGTVVISGVHSDYGYYIKIDHGNGMETLYAHCLENSLMVNVGDQVVAGQPISLVGQTGYATGPHLHFEVIIDGNRVDPKPYLGLS